MEEGALNAVLTGRIGFWTAALHLGALWALAFVQPLFELLGDSAEFFVARGNTASDILIFALSYGLVPPLVGAFAVWAAGRVRPALGWIAHLALIGLLVAALLVPPLGDAFSGSAASLAVALLLGVGAALLYLRTTVAKTFLTVLSPAPLVVLVLFLIFSPVEDLVFPREASGSLVGPSQSSTPIVHVILDELPVTTLERPDGTFESELFPHLARLVRGATWYRNATTVADSTPDAVPVQLTGERPDPDALPIYRDHPRSLFTLFARSHDLAVVEPITDICPQKLCAEARPPAEARLRALASDLSVVAEHLLLPDDLRTGLPPIDESWEGFGDVAAAAPPTEGDRKRREEVIGEVLDRLRATDARVGFKRVTAALDRPHVRPPLVFLHSTLPHAPWRYLPDGRAYEVLGNGYPRAGGAWPGHPQWVIDQGFQRHVLQVQYVDALVGRLLRHLRKSGLYDRAVIVVTADHGASFRTGLPRRLLTAGNLSEIAPVPLIVKYPGQREGTISDQAVRTIDVLPTIAKAAGVNLPWSTDGMPAGERPTSPDAAIDVTRAGRRGQEQPLAQILAARNERDAYEAQLLSHGVFAVGPRSDLLGRPAGRVARAVGGARATIDGARDYKDVAHAAVTPASVTGQVHGVPESTAIAVAVNGRIEATTWLVREDGRLVYDALVNPSALKPRSNRIAVLAVGADGLRALATAGYAQPGATPRRTH